MKAIFIDCNKQLAPVFARVLRPDDPPITVYGEAFSSPDLPRLLAGYDVCLDDHSYMPTEMMAQCRSLKHIVFLGTGASSYMDVAALDGLGIKVHTIKGYGDTAVAEHAIALMLAAAGLVRLGIRRPDILVLAPQLCVPAPGQGLLAIEGRTDDAAVGAALTGLDDADAHASLIAERAVLAGMGGGCMTPLGALCVPSELGLWVTAFAAEDADGVGGRHVTITSPDRDPVAAGAAAVAALRAAAA